MRITREMTWNGGGGGETERETESRCIFSLQSEMQHQKYFCSILYLKWSRKQSAEWKSNDERRIHMKTVDDGTEWERAREGEEWTTANHWNFQRLAHAVAAEWCWCQAKRAGVHARTHSRERECASHSTHKHHTDTHTHTHVSDRAYHENLIFNFETRERITEIVRSCPGYSVDSWCQEFKAVKAYSDYIDAFFHSSPSPSSSLLLDFFLLSSFIIVIIIVSFSLFLVFVFFSLKLRITKEERGGKNCSVLSIVENVKQMKWRLQCVHNAMCLSVCVCEWVWLRSTCVYVTCLPMQTAPRISYRMYHIRAAATAATAAPTTNDGWWLMMMTRDRSCVMSYSLSQSMRSTVHPVEHTFEAKLCLPKKKN